MEEEEEEMRKLWGSWDVPSADTTPKAAESAGPRQDRHIPLGLMTRVSPETSK